MVGLSTGPFGTFINDTIHPGGVQSHPITEGQPKMLCIVDKPCTRRHFRVLCSLDNYNLRVDCKSSEVCFR